MYQVSLFLFYVANKIEQPVQTLEAMASRRSLAAQYSRISCLLLELMSVGAWLRRDAIASYVSLFLLYEANKNLSANTNLESPHFKPFHFFLVYLHRLKNTCQ